MREHILSIVWLTPLVGMFVLMLIPRDNKNLIRLVANIVGLLGIVVSLPLVFWFDSSATEFQFVERMSWIPSLGVEYHLGIDGVSLLMIMLTTVVGFLSIWSSWTAIQDRVKEYYAFFLFLQAGMLGVFMALDLFLFYVFWEVMLVPMYFIIGIWGSSRRLYASIKFFLYTLAGSVLMLLAMLTLYLMHYQQFGFYSFALEDLMKVSVDLGTQMWLFWGFFFAFAIKVPMFPFHTWLPDAHTEAPTAGSVILAGILLKMGIYGLFRFSFPLLPDAARADVTVEIVAALSIIAIVYGALVSLMQKDWKKLVAYSSVSHLGFCTLGLIALNPNGMAGSILQGFNHGLSTSLLFLAVGVMYERRHTREIAEYGGLSNRMPVFTVLFAISMLASAGMPGLNGFIGEFVILRGAFEKNVYWAAFGALGIVLGAAYLLWLFQRVMLGPITNPKNEGIQDLNLREILVMLPLVIGCFWVGLYPKPYLEIMEKSVARVVERVDPGYFERAHLPNPLQPSDVPAAELARR
jgi:NADH-quinone oxidoreductase subunit M